MVPFSLLPPRLHGWPRVRRPSSILGWRERERAPSGRERVANGWTRTRRGGDSAVRIDGSAGMDDVVCSAVPLWGGEEGDTDGRWLLRHARKLPPLSLLPSQLYSHHVRSQRAREITLLPLPVPSRRARRGLACNYVRMARCPDGQSKRRAWRRAIASLSVYKLFNFYHQL